MFNVVTNISTFCCVVGSPVKTKKKIITVDNYSAKSSLSMKGKFNVWAI